MRRSPKLKDARRRRSGGTIHQNQQGHRSDRSHRSHRSHKSQRNSRGKALEKRGKMDTGWIAGIDTGGTFCDIVLRGPGVQRLLKVPSTPADPARAILDGLRRILAEAGAAGLAVPGQSGIAVVHGTTVATNTLLERKGAATAFITTAGFRDLIEIGRQNRLELYDLRVRRVEPLVPRRLRIEARERLRPGGEVETPIDLGGLRRALARLPAGIESIAVGFLFSCKNPAHEEAAVELARKHFPGIPVTASAQVSPEMREYERFSTAIANAYVAPRMVGYLRRLRAGLPETSVEIMGSGGGTLGLARALEEPILTALSGPAAGVLGARRIARRAGFESIITFDMGGTSTDVSLVDGGLSFRSESSIGGLPVRIPVVDVHTVGAGGGSIARFDSGGALRVGPESAGADPGPAVYGKGGPFTVTDAHVFLGHMDGGSFLGGAMAVEERRARELARRMSAPSGLSPRRFAAGVIEVINAEMEKAVRVVSQERGHDPRRFALVAFGGASGLHAAAMARRLLIPTVVVPPHPGLLCAQGMLGAERVRWRAASLVLPASACPPARLRAIAARLRREAAVDFSGLPRRALEERIELELRFQGQTHVVAVPFADDYEKLFRRTYRERYVHYDPAWPVEVVAVRLALSGSTAAEPAAAPERPPDRRSGRPRPKKVRPVSLDGGAPVRMPVYDRGALPAGFSMRGPAVIEEYSATTLVPGDFRLEVGGRGELVLRAL